MARPIHLFVSSSPDVVAEREALGQAAAALPVTVGWEIKHTPGPHEDAAEALTFAGACDVFLLVLGADFAAPMGLEWEVAAREARLVLRYRKRVMTSPSAQSFLRRVRLEWTSFDDAAQFKARVSLDLARVVLDQAEQFGLRLDEVEGLLALLQTEVKRQGREPDDRRGAERGGVILGRGA